MLMIYQDSYEHIYFEDIRNKRSEVSIKVNNKIYMLVIKEDGLYHLIKRTHLEKDWCVLLY